MIGTGGCVASDHRGLELATAAAADKSGAALRLWTMSAIAQAGQSPTAADAESDLPPPQCAIVAEWIRSYLMRPHADLGRAGDVCPFTALASRLDLVRIGVDYAGQRRGPCP